MIGKFLSALFNWLHFKLKKDALQGTVTDEKHWDSYNEKGKVNGKHFEYTISSKNEKGETIVYSYKEDMGRRSSQHYQKGDTVCFRLIRSSSAENENEIVTPEGLREDVKHYGLILLIVFCSIILLLVLAAAISVWRES